MLVGCWQYPEPAPGFGEVPDPPVRERVACPSAPQVAPLGEDGLVYGASVTDPPYTLVPFVSALMASGDKLFVARTWNGTFDADVVEIPTTARSDRCTAKVRWQSNGGFTVPSLAAYGGTVSFRGEGSFIALAESGGAPVVVSPGVLSAALDGPTIVGVVPEEASSPRFEVVFGSWEKPPLRSLGHYEGAGSAEMVTQDQRFAYVALGRGGHGRLGVLVVDKRDGTTVEVAATDGCVPNTPAPDGALWGSCAAGGFVRRDAAGVTRRLVVDTSGLERFAVGENDVVWLASQEGGADRTLFRARLDTAAADGTVTRERLRQMDVDRRPYESATLARAGRTLFVATTRGSFSLESRIERITLPD